MRIGVYFNPPSMDEHEYQRLTEVLTAAGGEAPRDRVCHICFGHGDGLQIFEVWESRAAFDAFYEAAMPGLIRAGIDPGPPMIEPVVNAVSTTRQPVANAV